MITICTNNEHNRSHLISAIIDAGQTEAQAELLCETDEEDIWIDIFMSVDMSPFGSYNVSRHFRDWNGGKYYRRGFRAGILHSDVSQDEADEKMTIMDKIIFDELTENWI